MKEFFSFISEQHEKLFQQIVVHIELVFGSVALASLLAVPLGILLSRHARASGIFIGLAGIFQTIPSLALLGILIPFLGIGSIPALFALFIYALLPILSNTYTGINQVDPLLKESAKAIGLTDFETLIKIELPLSLPFIVAGVRTAAVINVGVATLAAYVGGGGLGEFIFGGISLNNPVMMLAGAIPAALLALLIDFLLSLLQHAGFSQIRNTGLTVAALVCILFIVSHKSAQTGKPQLLAGLTPEFIGRQDGFPGLQKVYNLKIRNVIVNDAIMYTALKEKKLDVISGYTTDGRLKSYGLVVLQDDKSVFPPYYAAPLVRSSVIEQHPELKTVFDLLKGSISNEEMILMNYKLDYLKSSPENIAKEFLVKKGLYHVPLEANGETLVIGAKIFGEQQILINLYSILIRGYTHLATILKPNLGGTQICFAALLRHDIDFYVEYSGTALLVILKPIANMHKQIKLNENEVFEFVKHSMKRNFGLSYLEPIGFDNSYALMMRKQEARLLRLKNISDLSWYTHN